MNHTRLSKAKQSRKIRSSIHSISNSESDNETNNRDRLFWLKNCSRETIRLWELRKEIGVTFDGEDETILRKLDKLEARDKELKKDNEARVTINNK